MQNRFMCVPSACSKVWGFPGRHSARRLGGLAQGGQTHLGPAQLRIVVSACHSLRWASISPQDIHLQALSSKNFLYLVCLKD